MERLGNSVAAGEEEAQLPVLQLVWGISSWHLHHGRHRRTPEPIPSRPLPTAPVCRIPTVSWALLQRQQPKELAPCMGVVGSSKPRNKMVGGRLTGVVDMSVFLGMSLINSSVRFLRLTRTGSVA